MTQAIAGVSPSEVSEATIMTVWPTIATIAPGRLLGRLYSIRAGLGNILTVGHLIALLSIPVALLLFFGGLAPGVCRRYVLTNRRVVVRKGLLAADERWVSLDHFDSISVEVLPGQEWFHAGELIFKKGAVETFRLSGVSRPATFQHTCLKAQRSRAGVRKAMAHA